MVFELEALWKQNEMTCVRRFEPSKISIVLSSPDFSGFFRAFFGLCVCVFGFTPPRYGLFCNEKMFGFVDSKGQAFIKTDESSKDELIQLGGIKHSRMPYYSISSEVIANTQLLSKIIKQAISIIKK